jgi:hypothetical protein
MTALLSGDAEIYVNTLRGSSESLVDNLPTNKENSKWYAYSGTNSGVIAIEETNANFC